MKQMNLKKWMLIVISIAVVYLLLLIPQAEPKVELLNRKQPFLWNRDAQWEGLEKQFRLARLDPPPELESRIDGRVEAVGTLLESIETAPLDAESEIFNRLEEEMFHLAPQVAACSTRLPLYIELCNRLRRIVKQQSQQWDMNQDMIRSRLYRLLYGTRWALEEVMLQTGEETFANLTIAQEVPSATPVAAMLGVNIYSGDILVSRGGAATSALIARGNDYPGNFSHIALVHVDEKTHLASIIEAHIERGTVVSTLEEYITDKKLRVMVLRLRPDHPALLSDPLLPHKVAQAALKETLDRHIPYDFAMDYRNHDQLFCSEVASAAYSRFGIQLWMGISTLSSPGLASWLAAFGVRHFETQEPSDLEYDPQLSVVAEWRDRAILLEDHMDNAIIDVLLEGAEKGHRLTYAWYMLPIGRVMKGYSLLLNLFKAVGPIPEGMSATAALKNRRFSATHARMKEQLIIQVNDYKHKNGYMPPYWDLLKLAEKTR